MGKDNASAALDSQLAAKKAEYTKFVAASEAKIAEIQTELDKWEKMRPFTEMTHVELVSEIQFSIGSPSCKWRIISLYSLKPTMNGKIECVLNKRGIKQLH